MKHEEIQAEIAAICKDLGYEVIQEYRGKGWRADTLVVKGSERFVFEIQISPQTLETTLKRQARYTNEGIKCCWLFGRNLPGIRKLETIFRERPDLPMFQVSKSDKLPHSSFVVSLGERREVSLREFVSAFLQNHIRFSSTLRTSSKQRVTISFIEITCWKCKAVNHFYTVSPFRSACHAFIFPEESLWDSGKVEYRPDIIRIVREFINTERGRHIRLGEIKKRFSNTIQDSYMSFGCYKCDSLFGDWYIAEARLESFYCSSQNVSVEAEIKLNFDEIKQLPIPHWCYPGDLPFCDSPETS